MTDQVHQGDMREVLATLKDGSVDMCVTSPPYLGQRAYAGETECLWADGWYGELGREPTVELYIAHVLECLGVKSEVYRVLSPYGTLWLNLGGCYNAGRRGGWPGGKRQWKDDRYQPRSGPDAPGYKPLDYIPMPHLVAMALQKEGWYLRRPIVWHKKGPMPESPNTWRWERCRVKVTKSDRADYGYSKDAYTVPQSAVRGPAKNYDVQPEANYEPCPGCPKCEPHGGLVLRYGAWRPTTSHEYVFLMSKTSRYFCDQDAVRTGYAEASIERGQYPVQTFGGGEIRGGQKGRARDEPGMHGAKGTGANARSVQSWPTANLPTIAGRDHFAAFSVELAAWCIRAGTSPRGYCPKCNRPWVRVVETAYHDQHIGQDEKYAKEQFATNVTYGRGSVERTTLGWKATCECDVGEPRPGIVLDPFGGSGTVGLAAKALWPASRDYILVEISEEYCEMARHRIRKGFAVNKKQREVAKDVLVEGVGRVTEVKLGL